MKLFFTALNLGIQIYLTNMYSNGPEYFFNVIVVTFLTFLFFNSASNVRENIGSLFLYIYIVCSTHIIALFQLCEQEKNFNFQDYQSLFFFGNNILLIFLFTSIVSKIVFKNKNNKNVLLPINNKRLPDFLVNTIIITGFFITGLSGYLGIGRMGAEAAVVLPFHLNGIFQLFRTNLMPFFIMIFIYHNIARNIKIKKSHIVIILIWGLFEMFVRLSKGALLQTLLPTIILLILQNTIPYKKLYKLVIPIFALFIFLYPIIEVMRHGNESVSIESFISARTSVKKNTVETHSPYLRVFMTGECYMSARSYVSNQDFFDFSKFPLIYSMGGSAAYATHIIDGYSYDAHHSSGTTGLVDALLIGGYGLCYIMTICLSIMGILIDRINTQSNILLKVLLLIVFCRTFVMSKTLTAFIDSIALPFIIYTLIEVIVILLYVKKNYTRLIAYTNN